MLGGAKCDKGALAKQDLPKMEQQIVTPGELITTDLGFMR